MFDADYDPAADQSKNPKHKTMFLVSFSKVYAFHSEFKKRAEPDPSTLTKNEDTIYGKMTAPILARWWTVGSGASYTFDYYLVLFHACQTVINLYKSSSTPNVVASHLFPMMLDQDNFLDLALIRSFHKKYINRHMDWFQSTNDLSGALGFQAHHVAVRYYLMHLNLQNFFMRTSMEDYMEALSRSSCICILTVPLVLSHG